MNNPVPWICGGGYGVPTYYGYGYWTGPDGDLLCVVDDINDAGYAEYALSPISRFRIVAWLLFFFKRLCHGTRKEKQVRTKNDHIRLPFSTETGNTGAPRIVDADGQLVCAFALQAHKRGNKWAWDAAQMIVHSVNHKGKDQC